MSAYKIEDFLFFYWKIGNIFILEKLEPVSLDLEGYVVGLSTFTSQGNNEFFYVKFKASEVKTKTIRIMKHTNIAVTNVILNNIKQAGSPVTAIKLSPRVYFFTIPRGVAPL